MDLLLGFSTPTRLLEDRVLGLVLITPILYKSRQEDALTQRDIQKTESAVCFELCYVLNGLEVVSY